MWQGLKTSRFNVATNHFNIGVSDIHDAVHVFICPNGDGAAGAAAVDDGADGAVAAAAAAA